MRFGAPLFFAKVVSRLTDRDSLQLHVFDSMKIRAKDESSDPTSKQALEQRAIDRAKRHAGSWVKLQNRSMTHQRKRFEHLLSIIEDEQRNEMSREIELLAPWKRRFSSKRLQGCSNGSHGKQCKAQW